MHHVIFSKLSYSQQHQRASFSMLDRNEERDTPWDFEWSNGTLSIRKDRLLADTSKEIGNINLKNWLTTVALKEYARINGKDEAWYKSFIQPLSNIDQIFNHLSNSTNQWKQYTQNGTINVRLTAANSFQTAQELAFKCGANLDLSRYQDEYPPVSDVEAEQVYEIETLRGSVQSRLIEVAEDVRAKSLYHRQKLEEELRREQEKFEEDLRHLSDKAAATFSDVDVIRESVVHKLTADDGELKKQSRETFEELQTLLETVTNLVDDVESRASNATEGIENSKDRLARLAQMEGRNELVRGFEETAKASLSTSRLWTGVLIFFGVFSLFFFGTVALYSEGLIGAVCGPKYMPPELNGQIGWTKILTRFSLTALAAYLLVYAGRQAIRNKNEHLYFTRMAIEFPALDAYLSPYPEADRLEIKTALLTKYFGNVSNEPVSEDLSPLPDPSGQKLMETTAQHIKDVVNKAKPGAGSK